MKLSHLVLSAALAATLAAGCTHRPKNITPLPAPDRLGGQVTTLDTKGPIGSSPLDGAGGPRNTTPGNPFPNGTRPNGSDLATDNAGATTTTPLDSTPGVSRNDTPQPPIGDWASRAQDPDTLRGDTVYFDFDKSIVKRNDAAKVAAIAEYLKGHPGYMLKLDGHADERGTEDYNRALGERRALSVREMLLNLGISAETVVTGTYGEDRPAELGHNEAAWAKNRRVEPILLLPSTSKR